METLKMFKMFAIICAVTVLECNTMYEDPPRIFDTKEECIAAAIVKEKYTREIIGDVKHLEIGCEPVNIV